jgi:hypothetical protein
VARRERHDLIDSAIENISSVRRRTLARARTRSAKAVSSSVAVLAPWKRTAMLNICAAS